MKSIDDRILESKLYHGGGEFTVSDMCGRCRNTAKEVRKSLDKLYAQGKLYKFIRLGNYVYQKPREPHPLINRRWSNYVPPRPASESHMNPWVVR